MEIEEEEHFDVPPILPLEPPTATARKLEDIYEELYRIEFHLVTSVRVSILYIHNLTLSTRTIIYIPFEPIFEIEKDHHKTKKRDH